MSVLGSRERRRARGPASGTRDEVRVMTVHGAKGLEADIVILADTTRMPAPSADRGNLLYTDDGVLYPVSDPEAPIAVLAAKQAAEQKAVAEKSAAQKAAAQPPH